MDYEDEQNVYLVENIVDRRVRRGRVEYRVRWKGFLPDQDSWEPFTSLKESCLPLIQKFHNRYRKMLQNKRRFSVPASTSQRLRLDRGAPDSHEVSSSDTDSKVKEDNVLTESNVSSNRSHQPSRASKRNVESKLLGTLSNRSSVVTTSSNITYTGSISVNPNCLIPSDSMDKVMHFTSGSASPTSTRLDSITARASIDSAASTVSNSTTSSGKGRRFPKAPTSRPHSSGRQPLNEGKSNGVPTSVKSKSDSPLNQSKSQQGIPSRSGKAQIQSVNAQPKANRGSAQTGKSLPSHDRDDTVTENGVPETGRKSVTIMLKTSPTHEFHSTKALQTQQHTTSLAVSPHARSHNVKKVPDITISHDQQPQQPTRPVVAPSPSHNTTLVLPSESAMAKVLAIVQQLRALRRRPVQSLIIELSQRNHSLTQGEALYALNCLVSQGHLHEVTFSDGISYRLDPAVAVRGDLSRPTTLSAKIKAKYASKIKRKKGNTQSVSNVSPGSKRSTSATEVHSASAKRPRPNAAVSHTVAGFPAHTPWSTPANQSWPAYQSTFGRVLKPTSVRTIGFRQFSRDNFPTSQALDLSGSDLSNSFAHPATRPSGTNESNSIAAHESSVSSPHSVQPFGSRIFVVPPASPIRDANIELRFNSLPHRRLNQPFSSSETVTDGNDRSDLGNRDSEVHPPAVVISGHIAEPGSVVQSTELPSNGTSTTSRRSSTRQTEAIYKFKSILVKKNVEGCFTEVWLQSPGSLLKNAFTVQVLEELTAALNQAVFDTSRLVMICGMGTVFSAGIDLTALTGPLPNRSSVSHHNHSNFAYSSTGDLPTTSTGHSSLCYCCPSQSTSSSGNCTKIPHPHSLFCVNNSSGRSALPLDQSMCQRLGSALRAFLLALVTFPKPIVVGVNGPAMGLAVAMLPLCDLVYVSDTATFQIPYTKLCQTPEGGSSFTLASLVGLPLANELLLTGRKLSAREALQRGLASDLLYPKCFKEELVMRCRKLASSSPMALELTKCIIRMQHRERIEFVVNTECRKLIEVWQTPEFRASALDFLLRDMGDFL